MVVRAAQAGIITRDKALELLGDPAKESTLLERQMAVFDAAIKNQQARAMEYLRKPVTFVKPAPVDEASIYGVAPSEYAFEPTPLGGKYIYRNILPVDAPKPRKVNPLDRLIDGWTLRSLVNVDASARRENVTAQVARSCFTPAQRAAVSAHWSAELRAKVEASRKADAERERLRVVVDLEDQ